MWYQQHETWEKAKDYILARDPADRKYCSLVMSDIPVYFLADFDLVRAATDDSKKITKQLFICLCAIRDVFRSVYPAFGDDFKIRRMWIFDGSRDDKWSYHIHAHPSAPTPVWANLKDLGEFMKNHVMPELIKRNVSWKFDPMVYGANQNVKLPLNRKPDKPNMTFVKMSVGTDLTDRFKLDVGRVMAPDATLLLPLLVSEKFKVSKKRKIGATVAVTDEAYLALAEAFKPIMGANVAIYAVEVEDEDNFKGTCVQGTAMCPFKKRVHSGNRMKFNGVRHGCWLRCFDEVCVLDKSRKYVPLSAKQTLAIFGK